MYDVDARAKATGGPKIKVGGKVYEGHPLSAPQMIEFLARSEKLGEMGEDDGIEVLRVLSDLLADVLKAGGFPPAVAKQIPIDQVDEVLASFFSQMTSNLNRRTRRATKSTNSSGKRTSRSRAASA